MMWQWPEEMLRETKRLTDQKLAPLRRVVELRRARAATKEEGDKA